MTGGGWASPIVGRGGVIDVGNGNMPINISPKRSLLSSKGLPPSHQKKSSLFLGRGNPAAGGWAGRVGRQQVRLLGEEGAPLIGRPPCAKRGRFCAPKTFKKRKIWKLNFQKNKQFLCTVKFLLCSVYLYLKIYHTILHLSFCDLFFLLQIPLKIWHMGEILKYYLVQENEAGWGVRIPQNGPKTGPIIHLVIKKFRV